MMKEKFKRCKEFVIEHKKEIAVGLLAVAGGVVAYKVIKKVPTKLNGADKAIVKIADSGFVENLDFPDLDIGTIEEIWRDEFGKNLILNDITVGDMGKIGEEFLKIDGVTKDTVVTAVIGLLDKVEEVHEF